MISKATDSWQAESVAGSYALIVQDDESVLIVVG